MSRHGTNYTFAGRLTVTIDRDDDCFPPQWRMCIGGVHTKWCSDPTEPLSIVHDGRRFIFVTNSIWPAGSLPVGEPFEIVRPV